jgi:hypothetical protein
MRIHLCAFLILSASTSRAQPGDTGTRIEIHVDPDTGANPPYPEVYETDSNATVPPSDTLTILDEVPPFRFGPIAPLERDLPPLRYSPLPAYPVPDSLTQEQKTIAEFPAYWAQVEAANGINDLRRRLGMPVPGEKPSPFQKWLPALGTIGPSGQLNLYAVAKAIYKEWKDQKTAQEKRQRFQSRARGLMRLTRELGGQREAAPAASMITAKLEFMSERVEGKLPSRYDRELFTESLKGWAENPLLDSTGLSPGLLDICRAYEEYGP